ncbi:MAG: DUF3306 domain-containing protein [Pelagimonas sp.]|jgi:hypothetical protein|nr:DUF3306 domain-containing protein [Pelagimonas sp.]
MSDFWSRRKASVQAETRAEEQARLDALEQTREAALAERSDEDLLAEAGLPVPEELDSAEAVQDFLKSALPQRLKTRALRKLWTLNPVLANLDGLVDYGEDFTDSATVVENLQTVYQVGKGMFDKAQELAEQAERALTAEAEEEIAEDAPPSPAPVAEAPIPVAYTDPIETEESDAAEGLPASVRRMRFHFEQV